MAVWTILEYAEDSGRVPYLDWFSGLPIGAQAAIDARLLTLRAMARWPEKWASDYKGISGLKELRVSHDKVQYRPFFCYGLGRREIILLGGGVEKNGKIPAGLIEALRKRMDKYKAAPNHRTREYDFG